MARTSRLPGFYKISVQERRVLVGDATGADPDDIARALDAGGLDADTADKFVENVLGTYALPYGVALNVRVNGRDHVVPMVIEEPSVVAAASNAAKMVQGVRGLRGRGGPAAHDRAGADPLDRRRERRRGRGPGTRRGDRELADAAIPGLVARGGGARGVEARVLADDIVVVHVIVDCQDAMGANLVNTVAEAVADRVAAIAERSRRAAHPVEPLRQALRPGAAAAVERTCSPPTR